jgi:hypothetical protein
MKRLLGILLAGGLASGCGGDGGVDLLIDLNILAVTNTPDDFVIAGVATSISGTRTYDWNCSSGQANLVIGATLTNGSVRLEVWDDDHHLVHDNRYEAALIGGVTAFTKSGGAPGTWRLRFTFHDALWSGALTVSTDTLDDPDAIDIGGTGALDVSWIFEPGWGAAPVNVTIGGLSGGWVRVRLWDGNGDLVYTRTVAGASGVTDTPSGAAGVWLVQIDFDHAISAARAP